MITSGSIAYSQNDTSVTITSEQLKQIRLLYIDYQECKELNDSYTVSISQFEEQSILMDKLILNKENQIIIRDSIIDNMGKIIDNKDIQLENEKEKVSIERRKKILFEILFSVASIIAVIK